MNRRKEIRQAVVTALQGSTIAQDRVFARHPTEFPEDALPGLIVYDDSEEIQARTGRGGLVRVVSVVIEGRLTPGGSPVDEALDDLAGEVETAMLAANLGSFVAAVHLTGTEKATAVDAEIELGAVRLTYEVRYVTNS